MIMNRCMSRHHGFTLVELLVVIAIVALLLGILAPTLAAARDSGQAAACRSNIRQLQIANTLYADDHHGLYAPGAARFVQENRHRWHGTRSMMDEPFEPDGGSLTDYLDGTGASRKVRSCPSFTDVLDRKGAFERGSGGYGYNNAYVGTRRAERRDQWEVVTDLTGAPADLFLSPARTAAFADAAFAADDLIEYSFLEPRFHPDRPSYRLDPSTHFRHAGMAGIAFLDGHVDGETLTFTWSSGLYLMPPEALGIGWFGAHDDDRPYRPR
jgi:prepilin-type N-terminal cleavage/methylation domain-containing protein/prepilin-type processing-associated H-X9-DG protein